MDRLPEGARRTLERAAGARLSYEVRVLRGPDGRLLAVLGEAHMKLAKAAALGRDVVQEFELRGVETFQRKEVAGGRALALVIIAPRTLLRALSFGTVHGSTITDAKQLPSGYTVEIERGTPTPLGLHVASLYMTAFFVVSILAGLTPAVAPIAWFFRMHMLALIPGLALRRHRWSWMIHPFLGILSLRDELMAAGTLRMLEDHPEIEAAVVVMGRAHVAGYARILIERHGFSDQGLA
jgi:hypothetical protein